VRDRKPDSGILQERGTGSRLLRDGEQNGEINHEIKHGQRGEAINRDREQHKRSERASHE